MFLNLVKRTDQLKKVGLSVVVMSGIIIFGGNSVYTLHSTSLFQKLGLDQQTAKYMTGVFSVISFVCNVTFGLLMKCFRKKKILLSTTLGLTISTTLTAIFGNWNAQVFLIISLATVLMGRAFVETGIWPLSFMLANELVEPELRMVAQSSMVFIMYVSLGVMAFLTPILIHYLEHWIFAICSCFSLSSLVFLYFKLPDV